jgi:hypothetical protein
MGFNFPIQSKREGFESEEFLQGAWQESKDILPYLRYVDPSERERFMQLSQQRQSRELLLQNLQAMVELGGGKIVESGIKIAAHKLSPVFRKVFPKSAKNIDEIADAYTPASEVVDSSGLPKYAGSINLQRQRIAKDLKLAEIRVADEFTKSKKINWAEVDAESAKIMQSEKAVAEIFEKRKRGSALSVVDRDVFRKAEIDGLYKFQNAMENATSAEQAIQIQNKFRDELFAPTSEVAREAGQALNIYKKEIGLSRLGKAFEKLDRNLNPRELKAFKELDLDNPTQVKRFMNELGDPKLMDYVYEYWYNSILSGIPTHAVNIASNTLWRVFQIPHRALTGAVDSMISVLKPGRQRTRFMNESLPLMMGYIRGKPQAAKRGWDMMRHGRVTEFETKWAQEIGSSLGAFDRSGSKVVRGVGKVLTVPTKALRTMDVYANSIAYDGQMQALAKRSWNLIKGKKPPFKDYSKKFVSEAPDWAHKEAMEFAKYTTFMSDPGQFSRWIIQGRDIVPGGRFVIPFVNTIGNLLKRGVEMTPGIGLALARNQNASEVVAKQLEGLIVAAMVYKKIEDGEITGAAPTNRAENEAFYRQGKKAWSMKVGDSYYQYRRVEPFNTIIASSVIFHKNIKQALAKGNDERATKLLWNMGNEFKNNLIDSSYLQGMSQLMDRYGGFKKMPTQIGASLMPFSGFWRSINRSYEASVEGSAKYRPGDTWTSAFANVIPGLYDLKEPKLNVWGKEIELEGGVFRQWLPYKWSKATEDPVEIFLEKLDVYPSLPSQRVTYKGTSFKLDDDIYRNYVIDVGYEAKRKLELKIKGTWGAAINNEKHHGLLKDRVDKLFVKERYRARQKAIKEQLTRGTLED